MIDPATIREHMAVVGSDGQHVGTVDAVEGDRLKLTKDDSRDGSHHYIPLTQVDRVDAQVHLSVPAISAVPGGAGAATGAAMASPLPATLNRAVEGAAPRRNFYLPWIVGAVGLILLLLLFKSYVGAKEAETITPYGAEQNTTASVVAPTTGAPVATTMGVSQLGGFLAAQQPVPQAFTFEQLNFDTGKSDVRAADEAEIDQVAQALKQHGDTHVRIAGYADARGSDPANRQLGQARAEAVKAALVSRGIDAGRIETASGGESDPVDTNATAGGQAENRRTELVVVTR